MYRFIIDDEEIASDIKFSEDQIAKFRQVFSLFDRDKDNSLTTKEVFEALNHLNLNLKQNDQEDKETFENGSNQKQRRFSQSMSGVKVG
ncbi:MAG: hypothetical protein EZS28_003477 [Streblomastix strix]|uniref:EF-hand domain-containing protein n=1 Tax=Streblomastix strix TaxID=222440 RepID=A0A5J4X2T5_9EUKA|nr:MAG: hypothetical protein EZS28_003477 [Streblomastix strix]